jgi:hypothetical protein
VRRRRFAPPLAPGLLHLSQRRPDVGQHRRPSRTRQVRSQPRLLPPHPRCRRRRDSRPTPASPPVPSSTAARSLARPRPTRSWPSHSPPRQRARSATRPLALRPFLPLRPARRRLVANCARSPTPPTHTPAMAATKQLCKTNCPESWFATSMTASTAITATRTPTSRMALKRSHSFSAFIPMARELCAYHRSVQLPYRSTLKEPAHGHCRLAQPARAEIQVL